MCMETITAYIGAFLSRFGSIQFNGVLSLNRCADQCPKEKERCKE